VLDPGGLQHDPDPVAELTPGRARIAPEHGHVAARAVAVTFEDLDRGGLAGAVVAEHRVDLAVLDLERQVLDGNQVAVTLRQPIGPDRDHRRSST
jgi:CheY-like chemotaxis protein